MFYRIVMNIKDEDSHLSVFRITEDNKQIPILAASEAETDEGTLLSVISHEKDPNPVIFIEAELEELISPLREILKESPSIDLDELKELTEGLDLDIPEEELDDED